MQHFKLVNKQGNITCQPLTNDITIGSSTDWSRYVIKAGKETGIVNIKENGYLVHNEGEWCHMLSIEPNLECNVKQLLTRTLELQENSEYDLYLSNQYDDLPTIYYVDKIQPKQESFKPRMSKKRKIECWFCMSSQSFDKSLVTQVASFYYITAAKGPLTITHGLIIPIDHMELLNIDEQHKLEIEKLIFNVFTHYKNNGLVAIFWITKRQLSSDRLHDYVSFIGLDQALMKKLPKFQLKEFSLDFERDNTCVFTCDTNTIQAIANPRFFDLLIHLFSNEKNWEQRQNKTLQEQCIEFIFTIPPLY